jgi:hypothetical protein
MGRTRQQLPQNKAYQRAESFDLSTQVGRAQLWHERLSRAKDELQLEGRKANIRQSAKWLNGSVKQTEEERYLNEALPAIEDVIHATIPTIPPFDVDPVQAGQEDITELCRSLLDSVYGTGLVNARRALIDAEWDDLTWGMGILKLVWSRQEYADEPEVTTIDKSPAQATDAEYENANPKEAIVAESDLDTLHVAIHEAGKEQWAPESDEYSSLEAHIRSHMARIGAQTWSFPLMSAVDPSRFLYDPDAEKWEDRHWEAELCDEMVSTLEKIPGIKNLNPKNCPPLDEFDNQAEDKKGNEEFDFENAKVQVWKIHDRMNRSYAILPAMRGNETKPLIETDWPYGSLDTYYPIVHKPIPRQIHGMQTIVLLEPVLRELANVNATIRKMIRKIAAYKKIAGKGMLSRTDISDLTNENLAVAEVNPAALANMGDYKAPPPPQELFQQRETLLAEVRRILASDIMEQGGDTPHQITASEATQRGMYREDRVGRRQRVISDALEWAGYSTLIMYRDFADEALQVRVVGPMGVAFQRLNPADIPGEIVVKVDVSVASESKLAQKSQEFLLYLDKAMSYAPQNTDAVSMLIDLGRRFGMRHPEKFFTQQPTMMPQEQPNASTPQMSNSPM